MEGRCAGGRVPPLTYCVRNSAKRSNVSSWRGARRGGRGARAPAEARGRGDWTQRSAGGARGGACGLERFAEVAFEALRPPAVAPISLSGGGVGGVPAFPSASLLPLSKSPTPADAGAKDSKNVEIAEVIVGAILGTNTLTVVLATVSTLYLHFHNPFDLRGTSVQNLSYLGSSLATMSQ